MTKAPFNFELRYDSINTSEYPKDAQEIGSPEFQAYLKNLLEQQHRSLGGNLDISFLEDRVAVSWASDASLDEQKEMAMGFLQKGDLNKAVPILRAILEVEPDDIDSLYNLGMVCSDQGKLPEAIELLTKVAEIDPKHNHAFVAIGVAQLRAGNHDLAEAALKEALKLDSDDPYSLRTLAVVHMNKQDYISAISILRHSLTLLPNDPISAFNLATCLFKTDLEKNIDEAAEIADHLINTNVGNEIADKAKDLQRQIAYRKFRDGSGKYENSDAVFYCIDALKKLKGLSKQEVASVALEIAQLGESGLKVNDLEVTYTIKSFPGKFNGLALVCLLHVAVQQTAPGTDSGFDVQEEYEIAKKLVEGSGN